MTVKIGCIVEGHGDVVAVPLLIHRIAAELHLLEELREASDSTQ